MKPTPSLSRNSARLRLTTKSVNGGYYKGNRTGSMGAHTNYGGYVIDWRKVRTYNCPKLDGFDVGPSGDESVWAKNHISQLTPFVTRQIEPTRPISVAQLSPRSLKKPIDFVSEAAYNEYVSFETRTRVDGLEMIRSFKADLPIKYAEVLRQTADPEEDEVEDTAEENETATREAGSDVQERPKHEELKP